MIQESKDKAFILEYVFYVSIYMKVYLYVLIKRHRNIDIYINAYTRACTGRLYLLSLALWVNRDSPTKFCLQWVLLQKNNLFWALCQLVTSHQRSISLKQLAQRSLCCPAHRTLVTARQVTNPAKPREGAEVSAVWKSCSPRESFLFPPNS